MTTNEEPSQAGALPYRRREGQLEVLLITSRTRRRWIIPKGNIESDLTARESAAQEALEEGGVQGSIRKKEIGVYDHGIPPKTEPVILYLMEVTEELETYPEEDVRQRLWVSLDEARKRVYEEGLKRLLSEAEEVISGVA